MMEQWSGQALSLIFAESKKFKMFEQKPNLFYNFFILDFFKTYSLQPKGCFEPT